MMSFVVLCVVLVAGIQAAFVSLPPTQNEEYNNDGLACIKESGVTYEALAEARKGNIIDKAVYKFTYCYLKRADMITSDGKPNIDLRVLVAKLPPGIDQDEVKVMLERCSKSTNYTLLNYT